MLSTEILSQKMFCFMKTLSKFVILGGLSTLLYFEILVAELPYILLLKCLRNSFMIAKLIFGALEFWPMS